MPRVQLSRTNERKSGKFKSELEFDLKCKIESISCWMKFLLIFYFDEEALDNFPLLSLAHERERRGKEEKSIFNSLEASLSLSIIGTMTKSFFHHHIIIIVVRRGMLLLLPILRESFLPLIDILSSSPSNSHTSCSHSISPPLILRLIK